MTRARSPRSVCATRARAAVRGRARAQAMPWFVGGVLLLVLSLGLIEDGTLVFAAHRRASLLAESAARAGASQLDVALARTDPGLVGLWHWFWIANYRGEPLVFPLHLDLPWTLFWQTQVMSTSMECDDSTCLTRHAVTTSHLEDHSANFVDTIDVSVVLASAAFDWDFGDGTRDSHQFFDSATGLGRAYTDPYTESPVKWFYEFDSRDFVGGFPITLKGRWTGSYHIGSTSTFDGPFNEDGTLGGTREGTWQAQHVVCQVQALNIAPDYRPPAVPCRDPRVGP